MQKKKKYYGKMTHLGLTAIISIKLFEMNDLR